MNNNEMHLDVYKNRSELYSGESKTVFFEGRQSESRMLRTQRIVKAFTDGFYTDTMENLQEALASGGLTAEQVQLIKSLVDGVTSEVGRALV